MMRRIPVGDFRLGEDEKKAIMDVLDRGRLSEGAKTAEFERKFAAYVGTKHCVVTSSGSAALLCLLAALIQDERFPRFRPGAKVITSPLTYVATSNAVVLSGMEPVFADVDRETYGILPEAVESILSEGAPGEFCAILPVHLMGYPCRMDELRAIADRHGLVLLEDAAQAHGTNYGGKKCGSLGMAGIFSFYIAHNIQAGEMGCVTTDDDGIARAVKKIKANGRECDCPVCTRAEGYCPRLSTPGVWGQSLDGDPRFRHDLIGHNFKVMEFQPALGLTQLRKADEIFQARQENVRTLNAKLGRFSDILDLPPFDERVSYLAYPLAVKEASGIRRGDLRAALDKLGVETRPLFGCIPLHQPAYRGYRERYGGRLPNAEHLGLRAFYLGCHQYLEKGDIDIVERAMETAIARLACR